MNTRVGLYALLIGLFVASCTPLATETRAVATPAVQAVGLTETRGIASATPTIVEAKPTNTPQPMTSTAMPTATPTNQEPLVRASQEALLIGALSGINVACRWPCFWNIKPGSDDLETALSRFRGIGVTATGRLDSIDENTRGVAIGQYVTTGLALHLGIGDASEIKDIRVDVPRALAEDPAVFAPFPLSIVFEELGQPDEVFVAVQRRGACASCAERALVSMIVHFRKFGAVLSYQGSAPAQSGRVCQISNSDDLGLHLDHLYLYDASAGFDISSLPGFNPDVYVDLASGTGLDISEFATTALEEGDSFCVPFLK